MTIMDNTSITADELQTIKDASYSADPTGSAWDREYMCIARPDENTLIIPRYTQDRLLIARYERPEYYEPLHHFIVLDHGTVDFNAVLLATYDYPQAKLFIERELVLKNGPSTTQIAKAIKQVRSEVFGNTKIERAICDSISQQIRIDLNDEFEDLVFQSPMKSVLLSDNSGREGMVNQLINALNSGYIVIDPSCELLIETIKTGQWKVVGGKREFARFNSIGHCDFLAALIYTWRGCMPSRNVDPLIGRGFNYQTQLNINMPPRQDTKAVLGRVLNNSTQSVFNKTRIIGRRN
jgi:hypothetical protein